MSEITTKVAEKYKYLFKGYCFNFEGLKEKTKAGFVKLVKDMGAEVSDDALFTFVELSYFQKQENMKENLYDINYIVKAVETMDSSNLHNYKLIPTHNHQVSNLEPSCYASKFVFKTDSCHKCYYEIVFCKECAKSNIESQKETNEDYRSVKSLGIKDSNFESTDKVANFPSHFNDEEQRKSIHITKSPPRKRSKNSSSLNETVYDCTLLQNSVEYDSDENNTDFLNKSYEESRKEKFKEIHNEIKQKVVKKNSNANSLEDDNYSSDSSIHEKKKQLPTFNKGDSGWIYSLPNKIAPKKTEMTFKLSDQKTQEIFDEEDNAYFGRHKWWLPHEIPEKERCTFPACSYEPVAHPTHFLPRKFLSLVEKKILVKYLINKNGIAHSKGKIIYEKMISDGYLVHRSWETLRNCFRRTIITEITTYKLDPKILIQFLALSDKTIVLAKEERK
ncbi:uncharacterized protein LOC131669043 [Phymastichus coffea]|uniref:uncharacterized protein LOC131669043 n=1 Tax=Phymastichus coffea TaxID=108790 RepID=UPI00273CA176|nr:uncharacterized protein LOC131669043 [Phymastichus coffea]